MFSKKEKEIYSRMDDLNVKICTNSDNLTTIENKVDEVTGTINAGINTFRTGYHMSKWLAGLFGLLITSGFFGDNFIKFVRQAVLGIEPKPQQQQIQVAPQPTSKQPTSRPRTIQHQTYDSVKDIVGYQEEIIELQRQLIKERNK